MEAVEQFEDPALTPETASETGVEEGGGEVSAEGVGAGAAGDTPDAGSVLKMSADAQLESPSSPASQLAYESDAAQTAQQPLQAEKGTEVEKEKTPHGTHPH